MKIDSLQELVFVNHNTRSLSKQGLHYATPKAGSSMSSARRHVFEFLHPLPPTATFKTICFLESRLV